MKRIFNVDLSTGIIGEERIEERLLRDFIGGYGEIPISFSLS